MLADTDLKRTDSHTVIIFQRRTIFWTAWINTRQDPIDLCWHDTTYSETQGNFKAAVFEGTVFIIQLYFDFSFVLVHLHFWWTNLSPKSGIVLLFALQNIVGKQYAYPECPARWGACVMCKAYP